MPYRRGFSLVELVVTVVLIGVLGAIAVSYFQGASRDTLDSLGTRTLESAAAMQVLYRDSRGVFASTTAALDALTSDEVSMSLGPSSGPEVVSVYSASPDVLGLAVLAAPDRCLTLRVEVPGPGENVESRSVSSASQCIGELALL